MATIPENLLYTRDHEWLKVTGSEGQVGVSDFAQHQLGDIVYVELPKIGDKFVAGAPFGSVESVKSVNELFIPVAGEVIGINETLVDSPELVNTDPHEGGWMIKIKIINASEVDGLLSPAEYEDFIKEQE